MNGVIHTGAQRTILLLHKEEPFPSWRGRGMDNACYQRIVNIPLHGLPLRSGQRVKAPPRWRSTRQEVNRTVVRAVRRQRCSSGLTEHRSQVIVSLRYIRQAHRLLLQHRIRHDRGKCSTQTLRQTERAPSQKRTASPINVGVMFNQPGVIQRHRSGGRVNKEESDLLSMITSRVIV